MTGHQIQTKEKSLVDTDTTAVTNVAFAGNPNCGKTTLFNALTGANLKVANWPGVTVEKKEGFIRFQGERYKMVDLPGTYSLSSYTMEEIVARDYIVSDETDIIINITDASSLERNLYLTLQLIELGKPVVLALNMMDIVEERGMEIDLHRLPEMLGIPVIPVSARRRTGLKTLMHAVAHHRNHATDALEHHHEEGQHRHAHHTEYAMVYSDDIEDKIDIITAVLKERYPDLPSYRWIAIKYLENDLQITQQYPIALPDSIIGDCESQMINQKYAFIEEIMHETVVNRTEVSQKTDRADALLTHPFWGVPCFLAIMAVVFFLTFTVGDFIKEYFLIALDAISGWATDLLIAWNVGDLIISLIVDGIIAGVGGILTFLPNIFILFLALAFLEDSGYMARVAYVMDGIMNRLGLSGRAFIPMLLGFSCTVPAIMATRTLEDPRDKRKTILITPFMSCSARLPIYVLFSEAFFGKYAMLAAFSMYVIGLLIAILIAFFIGVFDKEKAHHSLLIELPEYKTPNARTVMIYVRDKVKDYLVKAGTTIFIASIVIWAILNFGPGGLVNDMSESFGAVIGHLLVPIMRPAGLPYWQIILALISGIAAKEVVVSSLSVLYGVANIASAEGMTQLTALLGSQGFGAANAYSLMLFCLLYVPCIATIATIRLETRSFKATLNAIVLQLGIAWLVSSLFFQIASLFL